MPNEKKLIYKCLVDDGAIKLFINDILHVILKQKELIGVQSWITGEKEKLYHIEYYFKRGYFYSEYDTIEKWQSVLNLLNENMTLNDVIT